jgi:hypothetical protein
LLWSAASNSGHEGATMVFHIRDGKVTEVWQSWTDQYAADEQFA